MEMISDTYIRMTPGPIDVHTHPRAFDVIAEHGSVPANEGREGKAGLRPFTEEAIKRGFTGIIAMPNESIRKKDAAAVPPETTILQPYPISNIDRVNAMAGLNQRGGGYSYRYLYGLGPGNLILEQIKNTYK